jgi:hypothetical protein
MPPTPPSTGRATPAQGAGEQVLGEVMEACVELALRDARAAVAARAVDHRWAIDRVLAALVRLADELLDADAPDDAQVARRVEACAALTHAAMCCEQLLGAASPAGLPAGRLVALRPWGGDRTFAVRRAPGEEIDGLAETATALRQAGMPGSDDAVLMLAAALAMDTAREMLCGAVAVRAGLPRGRPEHVRRSRGSMEEITDLEYGRGWEDSMSGRVRSPSRLLLAAMSLQAVPGACGPGDAGLLHGPGAAAKLVLVRGALVAFVRDVLAAWRGISTHDRLPAPRTDALVVDVAGRLDTFPVIAALAPAQLTVAAMSEAAHGAAAFVLRHSWELVAAPDAMRDVLVHDKLRVAVVDAMCAIALIDEDRARAAA